MGARSSNMAAHASARARTVGALAVGLLLVALALGASASAQGRNEPVIKAPGPPAGIRMPQAATNPGERIRPRAPDAVRRSLGTPDPSIGQDEVDRRLSARARERNEVRPGAARMGREPPLYPRPEPAVREPNERAPSFTDDDPIGWVLERDRERTRNSR